MNRSWTHGGNEITLIHIDTTKEKKADYSTTNIRNATDLTGFYRNVEWDLVEASALRNVLVYDCCPNTRYFDLTFFFKVRRKPLFYAVNLILPCVGITILSLLVFYLPSDSGEKVSSSNVY